MARIKIQSTREEAANQVLRMYKPTLDNWNFLIGYYFSQGFTQEEILQKCDDESKSLTYDRNKTRAFIKQYIHYKNSANCAPSPAPTISNSNTGAQISDSTKPKASMAAFTKGIDVINHFFTNTTPVLPMTPPDDSQEAAHYYYRHGFTPLPKSPIGGSAGKHPGVVYSNDQAGVHYRTTRYPESQIDVWDWKYGLCLLGDQNHCYLDIDCHPGQANDGMMWINEYLLQLIHSRHYEKTQGGGYHVFGLGEVRTVSQVEGIEIRGNTALIVSYPTPGYRINKYI